jgi:Tfp pilus assembly PilM family ATPase
MAARHTIAVDFGRRSLRAVLAVPQRASIHVQRTLSAPVPDDVSPDDPASFGKWIGEQLRESGFPRGGVIVALAREHVVLKRMMLPTRDAGELPEMTRLAMHRELPFDSQHAVIDYIPVEHSDAGTTVLAVAVPDSVVAHARAVMKAAGYGIERISLRGMGAAALMRTYGYDEHFTSLAIDVTNENVEFCIVASGVVRFSRGVEFTDAHDVRSIADRVRTETRRTWMSYRIVEEESAVTSAFLMGDRQVSDLVSQSIDDMLKVQTEVLGDHPMVHCDDESMDRVWPLAGLLLESQLDGELIDIAAPRKAPDRTAATRRRVFAAAAVVVLLLLAAWTFARRDLGALQREADTLRTTARNLTPEYAQFERDGARLNHLAMWEQTRVDWLDHLLFLQQQLPAPEQAVLDRVSGALRFNGVAYDRKAEPDQRWSAPKEITLVLQGEAADRETADRLRDRLVQPDWLITSSSGADVEGGKRLPFGFTYRMRTGEAQPPDENVARTDDAEAAPDA